MKKPNRMMSVDFALISVVSLGVLFIFQFLKRAVLQIDPDYFYHIGLSKIIANEAFIPRVLPQISGIGWDQFFTDKEFLFHVLTGAFYRIGGEGLVAKIPYILAALLVLSLLYFSYRIILFEPFHKTLKSLQLFLVLSPVFLTPYFLHRVTMLRPHLLAMVIFSWIIYSIVFRNWALAAFSSAIYALAYHAIEVPLAVCVVSWFCMAKNDQLRLKTLIASIIGLVIGVIINPYFPGNLVVGWQHMMIAMKQSQMSSQMPSILFGAELIPHRSDRFLFALSFPLATVFVFIWQGFGRRKSKESLLVFWNCILFWGLSLVSPRGLEFSIPLTVLLFSFFFREYQQKDQKKIFVLAIIAVFTCIFNYHDYFDMSFVSGSEEMGRALNKIPGNPGKNTVRQKVLNAAWDSGPFILYWRPDLQFLDILDPTFLLIENRALFLAREQLNSGMLMDPFGLVKNVFEAQYVLSYYPVLNSQLEADPRFKRLYPETAASDKVNVYQLKDRPPEVWVIEYDATVLESFSGGDHLKLDPSNIKPAWKRATLSDQAEELSIPYIDLTKWSKKVLGRDPAVAASAAVVSTATASIKTLCAWVRPAKSDLGASSELKKFVGKSLLAVGGGASFRIWINGKNLFESVGTSKYPRLIETFIPLPAALCEQDQIVALICGPETSKNLSFSLSFWQEDEIDEICREKGSPYLLSRKDSKLWPYLGSQINTCLGNLAARRL